MSDDLQRYGRELVTPFKVEITTGWGVTELCCDEVLRCLPAKRLVVRGTLDGKPVIAKIFLGRGNQRYFAREKAGVVALHRAHLNAPEILFEGHIADDARVLVLQFIESATSLEDVWLQAKTDQERSNLLRRAVKCIGQMHEVGMWQQDIHPGNFLDGQGLIYIIDGAAVVDSSPGGRLEESQSIDNLAAFLAEFAPRYDPLILSAFEEYEGTRQLPPNTGRRDKLMAGISRKRHYRKRKYLAKIFRDCTEFHCESSFDRFLVRARIDDGGELSKMLEDPDLAMATGRVLKEGNTATVKEVEVDGRKLVVKRYNIKNFFHGVRKAVFTGRARRSWYNAHLLKFYEIPGARPVALLEKRWGPFCLTSYYITESVTGPDAMEFFAGDSYMDRDIQQLADMVLELGRCQIRHRDLKATNFLMAATGPVLIDLDAMKQYKSAAFFRLIRDRDMARFMLNWRDYTKVYEAFLQALHKV